MTNPLKQFLRNLVPPAVRQDIRNRREAAFIRSLPDRRFLEEHILSWTVRQGGANILSVGCQFYTTIYEALLRKMGAELTTVDIDPDNARYGARTHRVCSVTAVTPAMFPARFDAVLLNGVIGWGLNTDDDIAAGLTALRAVMHPGAPMVVGWNTDQSEDPASRLAAAGFEPMDGPTGPSRVRFESVTHVYDFVRAVS